VLSETINKKIKEIKDLLIKAHDIEKELETVPLEQLRVEIQGIDDEVEKCDALLKEIAEKFAKKHISVIRDNEDKSNVKHWSERLISFLTIMIDEFEIMLAYTRRRANGTVKFIGELYKVELLTSKIMFGCINTLFGPVDDQITDDDMERLCKLLTVIGQQLEMSDKQALSDIFRRLKRLVDTNKRFETRVRFEIINIIELRASKWVPRVNQRSTEINPMKLDELEGKIRRQEHEKHREQEAFERNRQLRNLSPRRPRYGNHGQYNNQHRRYGNDRHK
jgi:tellurite resistance protein